jgi:hypothetical protein
MEEDDAKIQSSDKRLWKKKHGQDRNIVPISSKESRVASSPAGPPALSSTKIKV